ncbi:hypothetical protein HaLaN_09892, partial [Haematococcus lacustris]
MRGFKAALTTRRDRAAAKHKEQTEDLATITPITDIEHIPDLLRVARTAAIAAKHWTDDSAWQVGEALYSVMRKHDLEVLQSAQEDLKYLKDETRNRLIEEHLNMCARAFHAVTHGVEDFPYHDAANKKGRYDRLLEQGMLGSASPSGVELTAPLSDVVLYCVRPVKRCLLARASFSFRCFDDHRVMMETVIRDEPRNQPWDGPGPFVTSISLAVLKKGSL